MTASKPPGERELGRDARRNRFEEEWPELRKGLDRVLASRGVHSDKRDDLLQETGLRLYRRYDPQCCFEPFLGASGPWSVQGRARR